MAHILNVFISLKGSEELLRDHNSISFCDLNALKNTSQVGQVMPNAAKECLTLSEYRFHAVVTLSDENCTSLKARTSVCALPKMEKSDRKTVNNNLVANIGRCGTPHLVCKIRRTILNVILKCLYARGGFPIVPITATGRCYKSLHFSITFEPKVCFFSCFCPDKRVFT